MNKEQRFLQGLDLAGETVYDVGAYQGVFTLFFARAVGEKGRVVVFEPNPRSHQRILENVDLNGFTHVRVFAMALGNARGVAKLAYRRSEAEMGSLHGDLQAGIAGKPDAATVDVPVDTLDGLIEREGLPPPDFVKVDVEGAEADVLAGMVHTLDTRRPRLFIEIHGAGRTGKLANARHVVEFLHARGYRMRHVESEQDVGPENAADAMEGHLYCVPGEGEA